MAPITDSPELRQAIADARQLSDTFNTTVDQIENSESRHAIRDVERLQDDYWPAAADALERLLDLLP